jgi:hypothetical protein
MNKKLNNQIHSNVPWLIEMHIRLTGAADVEASGYTITKGSGYLTSATRTGEGVIQLAFKDRFKQIVGCHVLSSLQDIVPYLSAVSLDDATPTIDITCELFSDSAGAAVDPDSGILDITLEFCPSGLGYT